MSTTPVTFSSPAPAPATAVAAQDLAVLIGRALLAALFIPAGFGKLMGFAGTVGYIGSVGLPLPELGAVMAIVVELGFGLMLLVGFKTRWAALVLALFTVAAAFLFHNFWAMPADKVMANQTLFMKNLAIVGGLLAFAAGGPGRFSVDKR